MEKRIYHINVEDLPEMSSAEMDEYMKELMKTLNKNNSYISGSNMMKNFMIEHIDTWTN